MLPQVVNFTGYRLIRRTLEKRGGADHKQKIMDRSFTASSPKVCPPLINSNKELTNQNSRTVASWLLIGLNLHERM